MTYEIIVNSAEETKAFAARFAQLLTPGAIIGLDGDLGAGKTCFVKGLASGLGLDEHDTYSPTFTLIAEHYTGRLPLYHIDLYRLEGGDSEGLGLEEYLFGNGVTTIEWFQYLSVGIVTEYVLVALRITGEETRGLTVTAVGKRYEQMLQQLLTEQAVAGKV
ncbi:MAG: tRNA (adenosine(37)-N6)-threonylcarbamoyltransferase complex ATPase subunit type 1 TsaE [Deltaproteobacteria bacterium]|nr:tRNA (adenosine(37)-N6)-threonylcarbamoyltransferase complex ATPase subunit type 1 TsaE [Deltaproteobacteria bacterium]